MYELDDNGVPIKGSKRSARTKGDKDKDKDKSRPKVHSRRSDEKKLPKSDSGVEVGFPVMSGARQDDAMVPREIKIERRRSTTAGPSSRAAKDYEVKSPSKSRSSRPRDEATYFGIPKQTAAVPTAIAQPLPYRPHSVSQSYQSRPTSYHSAYQPVPYSHGPPISNMSFWNQAAPAMSFPPVAPSAGFMQNAAPPSEYPPPASPVTPRSLSSRFGGPERTGSGFGLRPVIQQQIHGSYDDYDDGYRSAAERTRRPSIRTSATKKVVHLTQAEIDAQAMPPPPPPARPASARPGPGPSILRRSGEYYTDVMTAPEPLYREQEYREPPPRERDYERGSRTLYREERAAQRPPSVSRPSYDYPDHRVEAANSSRRRQSYTGQSTSGSGASGGSRWEEQAAQANSYQADVNGAAPPAHPLTTDLLRRQERRQAGSTRSTKSSGSRDESDYRKSATTRTTRSVSSPEDENVTIKVTGQATVTVGGAQINCEGGEIEIKRQKSLRNGSEWSNSEYGDEPRRIDDRASRIDKPAGRSTRRSISYSRPSPSAQYAAQYQMGGYI